MHPNKRKEGIRMNLLIVDDDIIAVKGLLDGVNWGECGVDGNIWSACNAVQALKIVENEMIDIILCDIEMPGENGIEFIRKVRAFYPEIICIFLTCHAKFEYAQEAVRLGCQDYILTPAPYEAISEVIQKNVKELMELRQRKTMEKYSEQWLYQQEKIIENMQGYHNDISEIVEETVRFILSNLDSSELSVSSLAKRVYLNEDYLNRIFHQFAIEYFTNFFALNAFLLVFMSIRAVFK